MVLHTILQMPKLKWRHLNGVFRQKIEIPLAAWFTLLWDERVDIFEDRWCFNFFKCPLADLVYVGSHKLPRPARFEQFLTYLEAIFTGYPMWVDAKFKRHDMINLFSTITESTFLHSSVTSSHGYFEDQIVKDKRETITNLGCCLFLK